MKGLQKWILCALLLSPVSLAYGQSGLSEDDLSGGFQLSRQSAPQLELSPDRVEWAALPGELQVRVVREVSGKFQPIPGLSLIALGDGAGLISAITDSEGVARWQAKCSSGSRIRVETELKDSHFRVAQADFGRRNYRFGAEIPCEGLSQLILTSDSNAGQALSIWRVAYEAKLKLSASIGLSFWRRPLTFAWPGDGDYYFGGTITLTRGDHWDVVGHELGHAIYDLGRVGRMSGGQHKIDSCYNSTLALSEGWASYFSAYLGVSLSDSDAKFEFMVPRRAPLRFEAIPGDVCSGQTNEWRVTGFFWDLLDQHADGENLEVSFARLWSALEGSMVGSSKEAAERFQARGYFSTPALSQAWRQNFLTSEL